MPQRGCEAASQVLLGLRIRPASEVELLIIELRRRSAVDTSFLGSTAQRVLLDAPCPVLAVKAV